MDQSTPRRDMHQDQRLPGVVLRQFYFGHAGTGRFALHLANGLSEQAGFVLIMTMRRDGNTERRVQQSTSDLFDLYLTPIVAGYHFSKTEHVALSFNVWAPTGAYDPQLIANARLNNWTFVPQIAYTKLWPEHGFELDAVAAVRFYTRNTATDDRNAPLFTLDLMALKRFGNGASVGLIVGTVQQLGHDSGPLHTSSTVSSGATGL